MYRDVIIETYSAPGDPSRHQIRARPVEGQGFDTSMHVECSSRMREAYPIGTKLKIRAKITDREGGPSFLYSHYRWQHQVMSDDEAAIYVRTHHS